MPETDRFQGILEAHIATMLGVAGAKERRLADAEKTNDAYLKGLLTGGMDTLRNCAGWLQETLEKEKSRGTKAVLRGK